MDRDASAEGSLNPPASVAGDAEDAARSLAAVPLFAALTPLDRAKLAAVLEDRWVPAGEVVFEAGSRGDALYVLRSGTAERRVANSPIGTIRPPEVFGELALLTDDIRSASVIALTPLRAWALSRGRFEPLLKTEPGLVLRLTAAIGRSLAEARAALGTLQRELDGWVAERLAELTPRERELLGWAALLDRPESELLADLMGADRTALEGELARLARRSPLLVGDERGYQAPAAIRRALLRLRDGVEGAPPLAAAHQRAGVLVEERGDTERALTHFLAAEATADARRVFERAPEEIRAGLARDRRLPPDWAAEPTESGAVPADPTRRPRVGARAGRLAKSKALGGVLAALPLLLWWVPPQGLSPEAWRALLVLISGAVLLIFDVVPDAIVALMMVTGWVIPGLVPPAVALSGFASPSWLLVLSVLAVGAAVGNTGLLYRAALIVLARTPSHFGWRAVILALVGAVVTPALPNATSRMALAAPLVRELAEALGYRPGSRAAAGLGLAALIGFGQMAGLFLTGSSVGLLVHGLLPPEVRADFDFTRWFLAALPVHAVLFTISLTAVVAWYRPREVGPDGAGRLKLQRAVLGPTTRAEWLSLAVLLALVVGFITESIHGIGGAWLGVGVLVVLVAGGVLDGTMLRTGVNWNFMIFFGVITSLGGVFSSLQIDRWLAELLAGPVALLATNGALFCLGLGLAGFLLSLVVRWQAAAPLLTLVATPAATQVGVHPFLVALLALVSTQVWFFPFQSTIYLALYHGSGELFSHTQVRKMAFLWGPLVLISLVAAVPFWQWMGLLR